MGTHIYAVTQWHLELEEPEDWFSHTDTLNEYYTTHGADITGSGFVVADACSDMELYLSYSGYNELRYYITETIGKTLLGDLSLLINYTDCAGVIGPKYAGRIYLALERHKHLFMSDSYFNSYYCALLLVFKIAHGTPGALVRVG